MHETAVSDIQNGVSVSGKKEAAPKKEKPSTKKETKEK